MSLRQINFVPVLIIKYIQFSKETGLGISTGGRLAANGNCDTWYNYIRLTLGTFGCLAGAAQVGYGLASGFFSLGLGFVAAMAAIPGTMISCIEARNDWRGYQKGECKSPSSGKTAAQLLLECTSLSTGLAIAQRNYAELAGCVAAFVEAVMGIPAFNPSQQSSGRSTGDPHLTTADGYHYDFQGYGEFTFVKSMTDNFEVQVRQEDVSRTGYVTVTTAVGIQTGSDVVSITGKPFNLYVNNKVQDQNFTSLPLKNNASIRKTKEYGKDVFLITTASKDVVKVWFNGMYWLDVILYLNKTRNGKIVGLVGNYDGNKANDLQTRAGKQISGSFDDLYPTFADSWRIKDESLLYYEPGKNTESHTNRNFPKKQTTIDLVTWQNAQEICRKTGVFNDPYLTDCTTDVYYTGDASFAQSALWGQQNDTSSDIAISNDISYFKDVRITVSKTQATLEDSCLVNLRTGKVYQLKDGAKYADEIDGIFSYYCGIDVNPPATVITCGFSCGLSRTNNVLVNQNWSTYHTGAFELKGAVRDDDPTSTSNISNTTWANISSTNDIINLPWRTYIDANSKYAGTPVILAADSKNACEPNYFSTQTIYRFITQDGKKGVMRTKNFGKTKTGWWVTFDVKIQK